MALIADLSWLIGPGPAAPAIERVDERLTRVHDEQRGLLCICLIEARAPSYVAFRFEAPEDPRHFSTLIEFWVDDQGDGTVRLCVRESGFAPGPADVAEYQRTR